MNKNNYFMLLRALAIGAGVFILVVSMFFSANGFGFDDSAMVWAGIGLSFCVTIIELVWNREGSKANFTVVLAGLLCYAYGITTNVVGIYDARHVTGLEGWLMAGVIGGFLEIAAEPFIIWGLLGSFDEGDFFSAFLGKVNNNVQAGGGRPAGPF